MSVKFQRTARRYSPEDSILHKHRCESLISYRFTFNAQKVVECVECLRLAGRSVELSEM
jgi:hypothetical protein